MGFRSPSKAQEQSAQRAREAADRARQERKAAKELAERLRREEAWAESHRWH